MADYRPIPADRDDEYAAIERYAFRPTAGPVGGSAGERDGRSFGERRGLFEGGDLVAICEHVEFEARVRGAWLPLAGLSSVATPPDHRGQGHVGDLIAASLAEYREREWPVSALHPFDQDFYTRYGWKTGCRYLVATADTGALPGTGESTGQFRPVTAEDHDRLEPVYEAWMADRQLATRRSGEWWRRRIFRADGPGLTGYCWERDGQPRGYLVYAVRDGEDGSTMQVHEFAHADHEAYLNLLGFCHDHPRADSVRMYGHSQDRLVDVVGDRDALEVEVTPGRMVRLVDVPAALEAIEYPGVESAAVTLAVEDGHAPWNDGVFEVAVADGTASVRKTDADPEATVGVGTLSQLFVGYLSVERARRVGDLRIHAPRAANALDATFPERAVFLPEAF